MDLKDLGLTTHRLLRYAFGGFFGVFIAAVQRPDEVKKVVEAMGGVIGPVTALLAGSAAYVAYRYALGPVLLFPMRRACVALLRSVKRKRGFESSMSFLKTKGVDFWERQVALTRWRSQRYARLRSEKDQENDYLRSAEIGILYIAGVELVVGAQCASSYAGAWFWTGAAVLALALIADALHHQELVYWLKRDTEYDWSGNVEKGANGCLF